MRKSLMSFVLVCAICLGTLALGQSETLANEKKDTTSMLHPDFPVVTGLYKMTPEWAVNLPINLNKRIEGQDLVLWRPGFTIWVAIWGNDHNESLQEQLDGMLGIMSSEAFDKDIRKTNNVYYLSYRLTEKHGDKKVHALYGSAIGQEGKVNMSIYFDDENDLLFAKKIVGSISKY